MDINTVNHVVSKAYLSLKGRLGELKAEGVFRTVARWNNQLNKEKFEHQVICPAVYIEILENQWTSGANYELRRGELQFRLHVIVETTENFDIEDWELNQKIHEKVQGWQYAGIHNAFVATGDQTNHDYEVVIDNMLEYRTFVNDESLLRFQIKKKISDLDPSADIAQTTTIEATP